MTKFWKWINFIIAILLYIALFYFVIKTLRITLEFEVYYEYRSLLFKGWLRTIQVSAIGVTLSLIVGLVLYFMSQAKAIPILPMIAEIHKTIIFSTPLIVIAIVAYYFIGTAFGVDSRMFIGILTLGLYIGAYIADIYKGAIESIHINQWQTAKMFGFSKYQTYRYVIFPQVLKSILPPLAGQFALTIKGSALLSFMGLNEFLNEINVVQAISYKSFEGFILLSIGYWIITIPLIVAVRYFEEKLHVRVVK